MYPARLTSMAQTEDQAGTMLTREQQQSLDHEAQIALQQVDNLKYFLISAPVDWSPDQYIRRFLLPTGEYVSCVLWNNLFHISGTDIVRCLTFRFQAFGRPVKNPKKFEEGIFSDLRNLKAGSDASLEDPKSPFLDFLYKNNCIRTQKKQKVFYWYSVPHDRLFLDALERDLKREKMGQEATTQAISEPALSFEFDSNQSLYDQLSKGQATSSSTYNVNTQSVSQSPSPVLRAADSMPPPQMIPQAMPPLLPEEHLKQMPSTFPPIPMSQPMAPLSTKASERDYPQFQFDRNGVPLSQVAHRHTSMPAFMEYSPAPSFASSYYEDYSNRGISYEPLTPPQHSMSLGTETAYIANEDTGLYTAIPDPGLNANFNNMIHFPPSNLATPQYHNLPRNYATGNVFSAIEGSPTYKKRRRGSSIGINGAAAVPISSSIVRAAYRPSDLRRSVSYAMAPLAKAHDLTEPSMPAINRSYPLTAQRRDLAKTLRHDTPPRTATSSPVPASRQNSHHQIRKQVTNVDITESQAQASTCSRAASGVLRRARSATMTELSPYPTKSHCCPIPTCGRLFKRLEHLKRHVRTHTQERPYICNQCSKAFTRSDNLAQHRRIHEAQESGELPGNFQEQEEEEQEGEEEHDGEEEPQWEDDDRAEVVFDVNGEQGSPQNTFGYVSVPMPLGTSAPKVGSLAAIQEMHSGFPRGQGFGNGMMMAQRRSIGAENY